MFFNKFFNPTNNGNDEEVVISNDVQQEDTLDLVEKQEVVAVADTDDTGAQPAQPKQQSYDSRFYAEEESYLKNYALAKSVQAQSQKALAEEKALAELKEVETQVKQASDAWFGVVKSNKNKNKYLCPYGVEPPMSTMPILFIEEFVPPAPWSQYTNTDWRVYIFYDATTNSYVLNGTRRRRGESKTFHPDIRMTFASKSSLAFYLRKSMCAWQHDLSITMYSVSRNVIHILSTPNAIPNFHSIHHSRSKFRSELFGYDNCHPSTRTLKSYLKVLRDGTEGGVMFK
jgi:hypothetical protein